MKHFSRVIRSFVELAVIGFFAYLLYKFWKLVKNALAIEQLRLEKEKMNLLYQLHLAKQQEEFKDRTPVGFKVS